MYRTFCKEVVYRYGTCDAGSWLMLKFRSGTHELNEGFGRRRGREERKECTLCDDESESVSYVFWKCLVYNTQRNDVRRRNFLGMYLNVLSACIVLKRCVG